MNLPKQTGHAYRERRRRSWPSKYTPPRREAGIHMSCYTQIIYKIDRYTKYQERCKSDSAPPSLMEVYATIDSKGQWRTEKNREKKCPISTRSRACLIGMQTILGAARDPFLIVVSTPGP